MSLSFEVSCLLRSFKGILPGREDIERNVNSLICCIHIIKSAFAGLNRYIVLVRYLQNSCYKCTSSIDLKCKVIILFKKIRELSRQKMLSHCRFAFKSDLFKKRSCFFSVLCYFYIKFQQKLSFQSIILWVRIYDQNSPNMGMLVFLYT